MLSRDNVNWTEALDVNVTSSGQKIHTFAPSAARYIRIDCITRGTIYGNSIWDLNAYGDPSPGGAALGLGTAGALAVSTLVVKVAPKLTLTTTVPRATASMALNVTGPPLVPLAKATTVAGAVLDLFAGVPVPLPEPEPPGPPPERVRPGDELLASRRSWAKTQELFTSVPIERIPALVEVSWHGTEVYGESGAVALARTGGPYERLVGEVIRVRREKREIFVYVVAARDVPGDLSLTRRAFAALGLLALDRVSCASSR